MKIYMTKNNRQTDMKIYRTKTNSQTDEDIQDKNQLTDI